MNTLHQGFVNGGLTSFVVIDTGTLVSNNEEGLTVFDLLGVGTLIEFSQQSSSDTTGPNLSSDIPNPWKSDSTNAQTKIASLNDFGIILYTNGYQASDTDYLISNGQHALFKGYPKTFRINGGALSINVNPNGANASFNNNYLDKWVYDNGIIRIRFRWDTKADMYTQTHPDGSFYFFITKASPSAMLDKLGHESATLNFLGELELNKVYCIRSSIATAYGTVYNAAGGFAPDCSVMAYNRVTGNLVGKSRSNAQGQYTVQCLASKGDQLFLVWLDDDGVAPEFDAQVIDRIVV